MDSRDIEGIVMELETMLDNALTLPYIDDHGQEYVPASDVEQLRDRLRFVLDNTPTD